MTAIAQIVSKNFAFIGSDTFATYPKEIDDTQLRPRSYTNKTFLLPQFKSAFAVSGTLQAGLCFFNFIVESAYGIDIDSLLNIDLSYYDKRLKTNYEQYPTGSLYLTGYSNSSKRFKGFKLLVAFNAELKWQELPSDSFIFKPVVEDWENKLPRDSANYCDLIKEVMIIQKYEDEQKEFIEQVGIGGQVQCTQLAIDKGSDNLIIVTQIVHQFDDFETLGNKMIDNNNK